MLPSVIHNMPPVKNLRNLQPSVMPTKHKNMSNKCQIAGPSNHRLKGIVHFLSFCTIHLHQSNEASELYKLNNLLYFRFKLAPSLYVWISSLNVAFSIVIDSIFPLYEHWRNKRTPRGVQGYVLSRIQCLPIQRISSRWVDASHVSG